MTPEEDGIPPLDRSVGNLPGVSAERAIQLEKLKCPLIRNLLYLRPRRYEDRRNIRPIRDLSPEAHSLIRGKILTAGNKRLRGGRRLFEFELVLFINIKVKIKYPLLDIQYLFENSFPQN